VTGVKPSVTSVSRKREAGPQKRLRPLALAQCDQPPAPLQRTSVSAAAPRGWHLTKCKPSEICCPTSSSFQVPGIHVWRGLLLWDKYYPLGGENWLDTLNYTCRAFWCSKDTTHKEGML
jgi:hypothetical protein